MELLLCWSLVKIKENVHIFDGSLQIDHRALHGLSIWRISPGRGTVKTSVVPNQLHLHHKTSTSSLVLTICILSSYKIVDFGNLAASKWKQIHICLICHAWPCAINLITEMSSCLYGPEGSPFFVCRVQLHGYMNPEHQPGKPTGS